MGPALDVFLQPGQAVSMSLNYSCLLDVMRKGMQEDQRCAAKGVALAAAKPRLLPLLSAHLSFTEIAQELFLPNTSSRRRTRSTASWVSPHGPRQSHALLSWGSSPGEDRAFIPSGRWNPPRSHVDWC